MNICMLTTSFPRYEGDPAGHFVFELAEVLSKTHDIATIAPGMQGVASYETAGELRIFRFHYFFPFKYERLAYGDGIINNLAKGPLYKTLIPFFAIAFLAKSIRVGWRCDLIHAHWVFSGLIAVLGKMVHKKPIVLTVRGSDINVPFGGKRVSELVLRWVLKRCDYITTISNDLLKKITDQFGIDKKITVVPNGISLESFFPADRSEARKTLRLSDEIPIILYAGRITESKGVHSLVAAMPMVLKECKGAVFVFLGDGNLVEEIAKFCGRMGIEQNVLLLGSKPHGEIPIWLNAADLLVLPSLSEGRPNIVLEAMACGIPVVATRVGGIPELIREGENGFLVPPNDPKALGKAILTVLEMKTPRDVLGRKGREMLESLGLDWKTTAEKMTKIYKIVL